MGVSTGANTRAAFPALIPLQPVAMTTVATPEMLLTIPDVAARLEVSVSPAVHHEEDAQPSRAHSTWASAGGA